MESDIQSVKPAPRLDDYIISLLGGLFLGATAWALAFGLVVVIKAAAPPGINILDVITGMKLVPPPGLDLSKITITLSLPESQIINIAFVATPIFFGLVAGWIGYKKVLKLD